MELLPRSNNNEPSSRSSSSSLPPYSRQDPSTTNQQSPLDIPHQTMAGPNQIETFSETVSGTINVGHEAKQTAVVASPARTDLPTVIEITPSDPAPDEPTPNAESPESQDVDEARSEPTRTSGTHPPGASCGSYETVATQTAEVGNPTRPDQPLVLEIPPPSSPTPSQDENESGSVPASPA